MAKQIKVDVVRVFTNEASEFGNPVGLVLDEGRQLTDDQRQSIATKMGFSETVFINNVSDPDISIFDTIHPVKFAGHAAVGAAWYMSTLSEKNVDSIHCSGMDLPTWQDGQVRWVRAAMSLTPGWNHEQLDSPKDVDSITDNEAAQKEHVFVWAWINKSKGLVRARTFLPDWDILEDQGNGSGSMQRAVAESMPLEIQHGRGSVIYARPAANDQAEVGGRTTMDEPLTIEI